MSAKKIVFYSIFIIFSFFVISCATTSQKAKLNTLAYLENSPYKVFSEPEEKDYYLYVRFYNPSYKNKLSAGSLLQKGINIVETKPVSISHVAIGFNLNDKFYGLTAYSKPNLALEECSNVKSNRYMKSCDPKKSMQTLYAYKVTKEEWDKARAFVMNCIDKKLVRYEVNQNFDIAAREIGNFFGGNHKKEKNAKGKKPRAGENESKPVRMVKVLPKFEMDKENPFVCSNFTAWVLYNSVDSIKEYFDANYENLYMIAPSELTTIPGFELVFSSTWDTYMAGIEKIKSDKQRKEVLAVNQ